MALFTNGITGSASGGGGGASALISISGTTRFDDDADFASNVNVRGNATVIGDILIDDGGSLKEAGGTAAFTFDGDGNVTKIGVSTQTNGHFLKYDGSKWLGAAVTAGSMAADDLTAGDAAVTLTTTVGATVVSSSNSTVTIGSQDGITLNTEGHITLNADGTGDIILDADGGDVLLKDGGTNIGAITLATGSGDLQISCAVNDKDILFVGLDNNVPCTALRIDMSDAGTLLVHHDVLPMEDVQCNLGSASKRFANVYTGDLHLNNDRGNWTLIEEPNFLSLRNNYTGRRFKLLMEDITDSDDYGPDNEGNM